VIWKFILQRNHADNGAVRRGAFFVLQKNKSPGYHIRGIIITHANGSPEPPHNFFSHPDYTVGTGISPVQPPARVADYTAGGESHPAPKNLHLFYVVIIAQNAGYGKRFSFLKIKVVVVGRPFCCGHMLADMLK